MKEAKKFAKEHKVLTVAFAVSSAYAFIRTVQAMKREEGDFWPGVNGLGATTSTSTTTSSSHPMNRAPAGDMMKHPTALYGIGSNPDPDMEREWFSYGPGRGGEYKWVNRNPQSGASGRQSSGQQSSGRGDGGGSHSSSAYSGIGHCNCAVPTCPSCATKGLAGRSSYGDDTNKSSLSLMGTPNAIKRRTMRSNMESAEVYMSARESHMFSNQRRAEPTAEDVMGDLGMVDTLGATGWI